MSCLCRFGFEMSCGGVRRSTFVEELSRELHLAPDLSYNIDLVMDEAISNIIFYAYPEQQGGKIEIRVDYDGESLRFSLSDSGKPFDPTQVAEVDITLPAEQRAIGGLGISLIRQVMSEVEYRRVEEKNILTLIKNLG